MSDGDEQQPAYGPMTRIGTVAQELMQQLDAAYADLEDIQIGVCGLITEVHGRVVIDRPEHPRHGESVPYNDIAFYFNDERGWVQRGLMETALAILNQPIARRRRS